jgi:hypothetical protein
MKDTLLINCPNCGGELTGDGFCAYCKTKVRYANEIILEDEDWFTGNDVEIMIKRKIGDTVYLVPFVGSLTEIKQDFYTDNYYIEYDDKKIPIRNSSPEVTLTFHGTMKKIPVKHL